jgi:beta-lactam-binding protein with PASTA domain
MCYLKLYIKNSHTISKGKFKEDESVNTDVKGGISLSQGSDVCQFFMWQVII